MIFRRRRVRIEIEERTLRIGLFPGLEAAPGSPVVVDSTQGLKVAPESIARSEFNTVGQLSTAIKDELS